MFFRLFVLLRDGSPGRPLFVEALKTPGAAGSASASRNES